VESSDGGEGERGKELGQSRGSRSGWERKIVDVNGSVDKRSDELEEGEIDEGERGEGPSVRVGEDVEEKLGRETGHVRRTVGRKEEGGGDHDITVCDSLGEQIRMAKTEGKKMDVEDKKERAGIQREERRRPLTGCLVAGTNF
jgi:hypothetical protein